MIPIVIAFEDDLGEAVIEKTIEFSNPDFQITARYRSQGFGRMKANILAFNNAAKGSPQLVFTDLDKYGCPPELIADWLSKTRMSKYLLFRVACVEAESWLLADREETAKFFGVRVMHIPVNPDAVNDAKQEMFKLARRSNRKKLKVDILPREHSGAAIGPGYNDRLCAFVRERWDVDEAQKNSTSLRRTISALQRFTFP